MNNPFEYTPTAECDEAFRKLTGRLELLKKSDAAEDEHFLRELEAGKMLGVLIAVDERGERHTLYAFSGQIGDDGFQYPGFVEPVFDYLRPDGYFKTNEALISRQNYEISRFEEEILATAREAYAHAKGRMEKEISEAKERYRLSKRERDTRRSRGEVSEDDMAAMTRQSQFEKAELHRLKKRLAKEIAPLEETYKEALTTLDAMKEKRREDSANLQEWLFSNFRLLNANGESKNLSEIFADTAIRIPPSGAGECCAPKLLQAAYIRGLTPLTMAEYWYGHTKGGEVRKHGEHYPACRGKCRPVLNWMLQGLTVEPPLDNERCPGITIEPEIIYENNWFCIINKPSGMLSVPGKGTAVSVQSWLEERYCGGKEVKVAHRLDQDTSGLLVATFGHEAFKVMQSLFARRLVKKTYVADLEGNYIEKGMPEKGRIELPLIPDWLDRPRQRVDFRDGKEALTEYEFVGVHDGRSRVIFHPLTGRTHQLRVHSASEQGLGMPIAGDRLYGHNGGRGASRLHLHAGKLEFTFPVDSLRYSFEAPLPF